MNKLFSFILTSILLTGCTSNLLKQPVTITNDNYQTLCTPLVLHKQQKLIITLPSSNMTGYKWQLEKNGAPLLLLQKNKIQQDETPESNLHHQETLWKFKAIQVGKTTLSFIYLLEWDVNIANAQRVQCEIEVIDSYL